MEIKKEQIELILKEQSSYQHEYLAAFNGGNRVQMKICTCYIQAYNRVLGILSEID